MAADPTRAELEEIVRELAAFPRPSASPGERRAAELIAARLRALGHEPRIEEERAHGGYWWPLGLLSLAAGLAGLLGGRLVRAVVGAVTALGIWDELGLHRGVWTRALLPKRPTYNVVAETGDPSAARAVIVVAHHDAAHSGAIFDPTASRAIARRFPGYIERARWWFPVMRLVLAGPLLVALGARRLGTLMAFGSAAAFADIGRRDVVPGANDNLTGVATVLAVARRLAERPVSGLRVVLLSTGSEESFEEGMRAFVRRHGADLPPHRTAILALDTLGSPHLVLVEGEGMIVLADYDPRLKDIVEAAAGDAGVPVVREHYNAFGSDALVGMRKGYAAVLLASFDDAKLPSNYHWPSDVPENVDYSTVEEAVRVVEASIRRLAAT